MTNQQAREVVQASHERRMEVNRIATLLLDTWKRVDPNSAVAMHSASYVATFADLARAIVDDRIAAPSDGGAVEALPEDTPLSDFDYNELWQAIADATTIQGGTIAISVRTFRAALASARGAEA